MREKEKNKKQDESLKLKVQKKKIIVVILCSVLFTTILVKKIGVIFSEEDAKYKKENLQKIESNDLLNKITNKYIIDKYKDNIVITYFKRDKIINYVYNKEFSIDYILDMKENKDTIFYEVKSTYYDEVIYHVSEVKFINSNKIKYIYEDKSESIDYELLNKGQVIEEIKELYKDINNKTLLNELEKWLDINKEEMN